MRVEPIVTETPEFDWSEKSAERENDNASLVGAKVATFDLMRALLDEFPLHERMRLRMNILNLEVDDIHYRTALVFLGGAKHVDVLVTQDGPYHMNYYRNSVAHGFVKHPSVEQIIQAIRYVFFEDRGSKP